MFDNGLREFHELRMTLSSRHWGVLVLSGVLLVLWQFPGPWYAGKADGTQYLWFGLNEEIPGWEYKEISVGDAAEAILVADRMDNGEFHQEGGTLVRVFSAKRFEEKENSVGLFSHTPDRCWTNTGMVIQSEAPFFRKIEIHGIEMVLERRVFSMGSQRELVYFGALVGGSALPYRMDQYLGSGLRRESGSGGDKGGSIDRLVNTRVWSWALESFLKRARLAGPQQLIRISTPIRGPIESADERLLGFFEQWLRVVPYEEERKLFELQQAEAEEAEA